METEKPKYAQLRKGQNIESITLEEALGLFRLAPVTGQFEDSDVTVSTGRLDPMHCINQNFIPFERR